LCEHVKKKKKKKTKIISAISQKIYKTFLSVHERLYSYVDLIIHTRFSLFGKILEFEEGTNSLAQ
jgi:hypothetical protein